MINLSNPEVTFAIDAVREGALLAREVESSPARSPILKGDGSPVTAVDYAVQALVSARLEREFPSDVLVGEEGAVYLGRADSKDVVERVVKLVLSRRSTANADDIYHWIERGTAEPRERFWTLDPIDGTKGFVRGDQYVVALALVEKGKIEVGVLGCPKLRDGKIPDYNGPGSLVVASRGEGTWVTALDGESDWQRLRVSETKEFSKAVVLRSFEETHTEGSKLQRTLEFLGAKGPLVRMDSLAKYAVLASGGGDVLCRIPHKDDLAYREHIWDQAAGYLIIKEAGGRVTDLDGLPLDFTAGRKLYNNRGIVATNAHLHDRVLGAIRKAEAPRA